MLRKGVKNAVFAKIFQCGGHPPAESSASGDRRGLFSALRASTEFLAESTPVASLSIMELNLVSKPFKAFFIGFNALSLISKPLFLRLQSLNRGDERQILCTTDISFWFVSLDIL